MNQWTVAQCAFAVKAYYKSDDNIVDTQQLFRCQFDIKHNKPVPSGHAIKTWVKNFEETGSAIKKIAPDKETSVLAPENITTSKGVVESSRHSAPETSRKIKIEDVSDAEESLETKSLKIKAEQTNDTGNNQNIDVSLLCDVCGKHLSNKEKFKYHKRIHTGYKPHTCQTCSKSFIKKQLLKDHERVHTGEKPFICKFCGRGFAQRSPLRIHERIHTGEKPYVCRLCNKGYISKGAMVSHMKSCTGEI